MPRIILFLIFCLMICNYSGNVSGILLNTFSHDPDMDKNVSELITSKGYSLEEHTIQTTDGYLLSVQRIPYGRKNNSGSYNKDIVLLIHGLLGDATNWILNFPNQSLGFVLADEGYDVWLLNTRGCLYSKKHVQYKTSEHRFWNFSFEQAGRFDVPATIDFILNTTGKENLSVIGHSQGTTMTFAMLSEMPIYNKKVKLFIALAPVTTTGHITHVLKALVPFRSELAFLYYSIFSGDFFPNNEFFKLLKEEICGRLAPDVCLDVIFLVGGADKSQVNKTRLGVYFSHFPSGTSLKSILHYGQMVASKKFCRFDYGSRLNLKFYHQKDPPEYDPSVITTPVALFWSTNDKLADREDVAILRRKLQSLVFDYQVPYPYDHFDFVLALNAPELINEPILKLLSQSKM